MNDPLLSLYTQVHQRINKLSVQNKYKTIQNKAKQHQDVQDEFGRCANCVK